FSFRRFHADHIILHQRWKSNHNLCDGTITLSFIILHQRMEIKPQLTPRKDAVGIIILHQK
ncbi:hypothetical protein, partial [Treponema vincentii]|uniref:hypothetical protein n=1 Tax=Treponema vincentii TaxID=69710 RepID=UPI001E572B1B